MSAHRLSRKKYFKSKYLGRLKPLPLDRGNSRHRVYPFAKLNGLKNGKFLSQVGKLGKILVFEFTKILNGAGGALRILGFATVTPVQKNPMVRFFLKIFGDDFEKFFFHFQRRFSDGKTRTVTHAKDMGVDSDRGLTEGDV